MPTDSYFSAPGVNWSTLKEMRRSPAHYRHALFTDRVDTPSLKLGRVIHLAALEPDRFGSEVVVFDGPTRRGKAWDVFEEANADRTILTRKEREVALATGTAVRKDPVAGPLIAGGKFEQVMTWTDPGTGLACKGCVDLLCASPGIFGDLKSARDLDPRAFGAAAHKYGYVGQVAWYREGLFRSGHGTRTPKIIGVESSAPYDVGVFTIDPDLLDLALADCMELLRRVKVCRETDRWPGRYETEVELQLPRYAYPDDGEDDIAGAGLIFGEE